MTHVSDALWISISPYLQKFDQRLLSQLAKFQTVRRWEYSQTPDEPCWLETPVNLLHDYVQAFDQPLHLMGHGLGGVVGLIYARRFPQQVKSLTLLSVGANPAITWHSHYYALRQSLPCSREMILAHMTRLLFGQQGYDLTKILVQILERDLDQGFALHSLTHHTELSPGGIEAPLLICYGEQDRIVDRHAQACWQAWLKPEDRIWHCPEGTHFFHFNHPQPVVQAIRQHWQGTGLLSRSPCPLMPY